MKTKINVLRAVLARVARKTLLFATIVGSVVFALVFAGIWSLAHYFSNWWWLLLIIYLPLLIISVIVVLIGRFVVSRISSQRLSSEQHKLVNDFVDKIQRLLEARGIGWPFFVLLSMKDLLFYRELRTAKSLIADTSSLQKDFAELERKLQT